MTDISPPDRMKSPVVQVSFNTFLTRSHTKLSDFPLAKTSCVNEALLSRGKLKQRKSKIGSLDASLIGSSQSNRI